MANRVVKTVDGGELDAGAALRAYDAGGTSGPLGPLNEAAIAGMRNDLPFDTSGEYHETETDVLRDVITQAGGTEHGGSGFISIRRKDEKTNAWQYVGRVSPDEMLTDGPQDFLAQNFGAGEFELWVYNSARRIVGRPKTVISKLAEAFAKRKKGDEVSSSQNSDIRELAKMMHEGFAQLAAIVAAKPAAPVQTETRAQFLQELLQMKQIFGSDKSSTNPVEMFGQMAQLFRAMQPREASEGGVFMELLERFSPVILDHLNKGGAANAETAALPAPQLQPQPSPVASANPPAKPALSPEQQGAKQMSLQLKIQLDYLCQQAAHDTDPGPWAAIIAEQVPAEVLSALLNADNWLDEIAKFNPRVKKYPEWFGELREAIFEEFESKENLTPETRDGIQSENSGSGGDVSS